VPASRPNVWGSVSAREVPMTEPIPTIFRLNLHNLVDTLVGPFIIWLGNSECPIGRVVRKLFVIAGEPFERQACRAPITEIDRARGLE
jgi:hypothetical protein